MIKSTSMKDDDDWQSIHVKVAVWRKLRLLALQRDLKLGEMVAELVRKEEAVVETAESE